MNQKEVAQSLYKQFNDNDVSGPYWGGGPVRLPEFPLEYTHIEGGDDIFNDLVSDDSDNEELDNDIYEDDEYDEDYNILIDNEDTYIGGNEKILASEFILSIK